MKVLFSSGPKVSILCASPTEPRVATPKIWVSPLVNNPVPWVLGKIETSHSIGRISFSPLPSGLGLPERTNFLNVCSSTESNALSIWFFSKSSSRDLFTSSAIPAIDILKSDFPVDFEKASSSLFPETSMTL